MRRRKSLPPSQIASSDPERSSVLGPTINRWFLQTLLYPSTVCGKPTIMGDSDTSTVFVAELQGIRLALIMALEDWNKGSRRKKLIIYTDNQAAIRTVGNLRNPPKCLLSRTAMSGQPPKDLILLRFHSMSGTERRSPSN